MAIVLALDFGTSGCRSALYDSDLNMLYSSSEEYPLVVLSDSEIEQDAQLWWIKAKETIKGVIEQYPNAASDIKAISISSQGIALVPVSRSGETLHNAISWLDTRAVDEVEYISGHFGDETIYCRTGKRVSPTYTFSKLIWLKKHESDIYDKAWKILLPMDFIQYRLSGRCITDHTMAGGTMFYDVNTHTWAEDMLEEGSLNADKLPDIMWAGESIGKILPEVADELGLSRDVLIVNGAQDQKCAALGAGAAQNVAAVSLGTGSCIAQISASPVKDRDMRIPFFPYIDKETYDLEGVINTAGSAYSWFQREFASNQSFDALNSAAENVKLPNSVLFYPYLSGVSSPHWGDGTGTFTGMSLQSTMGHMARAVMEGIAFNLRENLDVMGNICGRANEIRLYGGGSKSPLWCQIIADITNTEVVCLCSSETALAGAAMLAFKPLGVKTPSSLPTGARFTPDSSRAAIYESAYRRYENTRDKLFK